MKNIHRPATPVLVSNNYLKRFSQKLQNTKTVVRHFLWISAASCGKVGHVISFSCSQWCCHLLSDATPLSCLNWHVQL